MLPAVYDTMYTKGVRVDERDQLFTAENIYILKFLADLQPMFMQEYLRKADIGNLLVSEVYNNSKSFAATVRTWKLQRQIISKAH